jgi:hypothetical protein
MIPFVVHVSTDPTRLNTCWLPSPDEVERGISVRLRIPQIVLHPCHNGVCLVFAESKDSGELLLMFSQ